VEILSSITIIRRPFGDSSLKNSFGTMTREQALKSLGKKLILLYEKKEGRK